MRAKRKSRFLPGLFLYALVLILICTAVLMLLQRYLAVYEATRPETALESYRSTLLSPSSTEGCRAALADLDDRLRTPEESLEDIRGLLSGAQFAERIADGSENEKHFRVLADGKCWGEVTLRAGEDRGFGLRDWQFSADQYDFSALFHGVSATVPPGYQVFVGEHRLGENELTASDIPYADLAEAYGMIDGLPRMVRYESGLYLGDLPLRVLDAEGREVDAADQQEAHYLDNCSAEDRAAVEEYVDSFLKPYILFTANMNQDVDRYYGEILPLTLPGSALRQRLNEGKLSAWWSNVRSLELVESKVSACTDLGDGRFLVDIDYTTRIVAISDPVTDSYSLRMVLDNTTGKLLGSFLYNR